MWLNNLWYKNKAQCNVRPAECDLTTCTYSLYKFLIGWSLMQGGALHPFQKYWGCSSTSSTPLPTPLCQQHTGDWNHLLCQGLLSSWQSIFESVCTSQNLNEEINTWFSAGSDQNLKLFVPETVYHSLSARAVCVCVCVHTVRTPSSTASLERYIAFVTLSAAMQLFVSALVSLLLITSGSAATVRYV